MDDDLHSDDAALYDGQSPKEEWHEVVHQSQAMQ